jgi:alkylation response protein AidB-like acyl-CoA dehydrogenase
MKTRGQYYAERAKELAALHRERPEVGAELAAVALKAVGEVLERCRVGRLTRHQHVLLRLGKLIASAECAGSLAKRAARALSGTLNPKADIRFQPPVLAALARIVARDAALEVASDGARWVVGAGGVAPGEVEALETALDTRAALRGQAGLIEDMDRVANAIYERA